MKSGPAENPLKDLSVVELDSLRARAVLANDEGTDTLCRQIDYEFLRRDVSRYPREYYSSVRVKA